MKQKNGFSLLKFFKKLSDFSSGVTGSRRVYSSVPVEDKVYYCKHVMVLLSWLRSGALGFSAEGPGRGAWGEHLNPAVGDWFPSCAGFAIPPGTRRRCCAPPIAISPCSEMSACQHSVRPAWCSSANQALESCDSSPAPGGTNHNGNAITSQGKLLGIQ